MTDFLQDHPQGHILSMDQLSLYFQATLTRVWAPVGQTPIVKVHPQREHVHFYGALDVRTGQDIALPVLEQTSTITANFICLLLIFFPTQPILLPLDGCIRFWGQRLSGLPKPVKRAIKDRR